MIRAKKFENRVRTTIYFDKQDVERMKNFYIATGVQMSELIRRAVEEYLDREFEKIKQRKK